MAWKQRWMEIQRAIPERKKSRRDDLPVIRKHEELRLQGQDRGNRLLIAEAPRYKDRRDAERPGQVVDDRGPESPIAAGGSGRRSDDTHQSNVIPLTKPDEALSTEPATAQKHGANARSAGPRHGHARALVASRTFASSSFSSSTAMSSSMESR